MSTQHINQFKVGEWACGPCSIAHSLGKDVTEVKDIILELIQTPSWKYNGKQKAYSGDGGIAAYDIVKYVNTKYDKNLTLTFLDRHVKKEDDKIVEEEKGIDYVKRVHSILKEALTKEHKPIIEIRSFVVKPDGWDYKWFCTIGHFNVIDSVQEELGENEHGFSYKFVDSLTGKLEHGYLYFEKYRNYAATRDFHVDDAGNEQWEWINEYPYMVAVTPNIHLNTQEYPFQARVITVLKAIMS